MDTRFHIPVPHLEPTVHEQAWAEEVIVPYAQKVLDNMRERDINFDKAHIPQDMFGSGTLGARMKDHVNRLGLKARGFAVFFGVAGFDRAVPHCDAHNVGTPMIARLNVPIRGIKNAKLSWWETGTEDERMLERRFEQWDGTKIKTGFSYLSAPDADWGEPVYTELSPGPCWNRVDLAHKLDLSEVTEDRVNITIELADQIPWDQLIKRLRYRQYI
jgi:hypothetical protein